MQPVTIAILILVIAFIVDIPISYGMIVASFAYLYFSGMDLSIAIEVMCSRTAGNYVILAVPLFVFAANLMNSGRITEKVFDFAKCLVGRARGGMGHVNVIASLIFSGMTGSAVADASGLGIMEIETMKKDGYDAGFSSAITAASAVIGPIFPPSIPFVIYAMIAEVSVGNMFLAGMAPGVFLAIALCIYVAYIAHKRDYPRGHRVTFKHFIKTTLSALPAIFTPVIILTSIYAGFATATEAAAVAGMYALIVSVIVYRSLDVKTFWSVVKESAKSAAQVGIMLTAAYAFSYVISLSGLPRMAGNFVGSVVSSKFSFLIICNIMLFILGMFLETSVIQLLTLPILVPIAEMYGIDLIHFGIMFTFNCMIGICTPPFGMLIFIVTGISKEKMSVIIKELAPMIGVMVIVLLVITFIPDSFMWLPNNFGR